MVNGSYIAIIVGCYLAYKIGCWVHDRNQEALARIERKTEGEQ